MRYYEQETGYTCGVACYRMVISHFSEEVPSEEELLAKLGTNADIGTHPDMIEKLGKEMGFEVIRGEQGTLAILRQLKEDGFVTMMAVSVDVPHWVVYLEDNGNHVFFNDPFFGERTARQISNFMSPNQKYPFYRWNVKPEEFKKYLPEYDFSTVASNGLYLAFKK